MKNKLLYRILQLVSLLLGMRFFVLIFFIFALYTSTFFLISGKSLEITLFDIKIHGIILCSVLSIAAGGLINQFYDQEKDKIIKPFRSKIQQFLKQKYILYFYLILNSLSLGISLFLSYRIFIFFLFYQFIIWLYSHKLSKKLLVNNLTYVLLSLYPFFGVLVYYQHFSAKIFLIAIFLFLMMLSIDIIKDLMTKEADCLLEYQTLPIVFGEAKTILIVKCILGINFGNSIFILKNSTDFSIYYFIFSCIFFGAILLLWKKKNYFILSGLLKIWIFIGLLFMLASGL